VTGFYIFASHATLH